MSVSLVPMLFGSNPSINTEVNSIAKQNKKFTALYFRIDDIYKMLNTRRNPCSFVTFQCLAHFYAAYLVSQCHCHYKGLAGNFCAISSLNCNFSLEIIQVSQSSCKPTCEVTIFAFLLKGMNINQNRITVHLVVETFLFTTRLY